MLAKQKQQSVHCSFHPLHDTGVALALINTNCLVILSITKHKLQKQVENKFYPISNTASKV
jgi:hypothetical protein